MNYREWKTLSDEEKKSTHWRKHPRIRVATIFSVLFAVFFTVVMLRIFQNRRMHVNRKPNDKEAFTMAKVFIKDRLKQPATASFPSTKFQSEIDTSKNSYGISSTVNSQDSTGKMIESRWNIILAYSGGDWADRRSWKITYIALNQ